MRNKQRRSYNKRPVLEGLEPRLLFSADALGGIALAMPADHALDLDLGIDLEALLFPDANADTRQQTPSSESE